MESRAKALRRHHELMRLRRLRQLLRKVMEEGKILLMASEQENDELIKLAGARGVH